MSDRCSKALNGQQLWPGKGKMLTNSPYLFLDLGDFMWTDHDNFCFFKSLHVRVALMSNEFSFGERISPILKEPKNAMVQAVQTICFVWGVQLVFATQSPRSFNKGNVITKRLTVFRGWEFSALLIKVLQM